MLFIRPCEGQVTSHFNPKRKHPITGKITPHNGIDIGSAKNNNILAAADGEVVFAAANGGYGNVIYIDHANGYQTRYAHLSKINVRTGQTVKVEQVIGVKGTTGNSTGVHLHFEVRHNGVFKNPVGYINDQSLALKRGVTGPRVKDLQRRLGITDDGSYGPLTEKAVKDFQKANKLAIDGFAGPATIAVLDTIKPPRPVANLKVDGHWGVETTKALQRYFGTIVDGVISKPSQVIKELQKLLGVKQDGYLGPITIKALQKHLGTVVDGVISKPSQMVRALQRALNNGKL